MIRLELLAMTCSLTSRLGRPCTPGRIQSCPSTHAEVKSSRWRPPDTIALHYVRSRGINVRRIGSMQCPWNALDQHHPGGQHGKDVPEQDEEGDWEEDGR